MEIRLIIKITHQPPIDTPASIKWKTFDLECPDKLGRILDVVPHCIPEIIGYERIPYKPK